MHILKVNETKKLETIIPDNQMKPKFLIIALFLCIGETFGQKIGSKTLDSLQSCLKYASNDSTRAGILIQVGTYWMDNGNFPLAIENLLRAKTIFENLKNEYGIFDSQNRLAIVYSNINDNSTALEYLKKCKESVDNGRLYDNFGLVYFNQNNIEQSKMYLQKSLDYYKNKHDNKMVARLSNKIGSCLEVQGQIENAILNYNQSLKMAEDTIDVLNALASLGDVYFSQKKYSLALEYENKSLTISERISDLLSMRETLKMLSDIYFIMGDCKTSLSFYKKHIEIKNKLVNNENTKKIVRTEMNFQFQKKEELAKYEQDKKDAIKQEEIRHQKRQTYIFVCGFGIVLCFSVFLFLTFKKTQRQKNIIEEQKKSVEESRREIMDNINYAKRIQDAVMTPISTIQENLPNSFVLNMARDTVSGDFLFLEKYKDEIIVAVADCTNHSVSGAMMSILCNNLLSEAITSGNHIPSDILNYVNTTISKKFHQTDNYNTKKELDIVKDGMDVIIVKLDLVNMKYQYAGAYNPLLIVRENQIVEIKADKLQLGQTKMQYKNNEGELQKNDMLYMSSDGYADQFSISGKKFMKKKFKELLVSINEKNTTEQKSILSQTMLEWKNGQEQTDDILVMGIKI